MTEEVQQKLIEEEMKESYVDYAMSVIMSRALPDVRDGLKPVHRRILYSMYKMKVFHDKPFKKCARVVGDCLGRYHPHGDTAVYDALIRMAQNFSLRYPLVIGQGNVGCFTGDTKIKLLDGTSKSFKELCNLYKENKIFYVYSIDKGGKVVVGEAKNPRLTKKKARIVELTLNNGDKIRCTPDHKFLLKNLKYKQAKDLTQKDSLMPGYFKLSPIRGNTELKDYLMIKSDKDEKYIFVHDIADKYNIENGIYTIDNGPVRHHLDFNKFNNNPTNIKRLTWKEHTRIHNEHVKRMWKNEEFRKKQAEAVKKYLKDNPQHIINLKERLRERNRDPEFIKKNTERLKNLWKDPKLREASSKRIKEFYEKNPEMRKIASENSKKMWSDPEKKKFIISRIREVVGSAEVRDKISKNNLWYIQNRPEFLKRRSEKLKDYYKKNPEARKAVSDRSKKLWQNQEYRSKFINEKYNHLSAIAKKAWKNEDYRRMQINKAKKLWEDVEFRDKLISSVKEANKIRLQKKPDFMKAIAKKAALSHKINWKKPEYKKNIIRNKILYYVNRLISKVGDKNINEQTYEFFRDKNCFPRYENAIKYFKDISEMVSLAKEYNHFVINVKFLDYEEDVYDITVDKHHNFLLDCGVFVHNSVDGDKPAAMRYVESKLARISEEMLSDIDKRTVNWMPNFDGSLNEPMVLPARVPNLLINGSSGIAVGMATNIPPHNIGEAINACVLLIDNPNASINEIMEKLKGPDFPTGGIILGRNGIKDYYETGKGKVIVKAKTHFEDNKIIITEIPYQVNKSSLIKSIAGLAREKIVEDITDLRDESDREGMRIVIETRKDADPDLVLNNLLRHTSLKTTFGVIMLGIYDNKPVIMNIKEAISYFILHRKEIVTRRTKFDLEQAENRSHILEGLIIALTNIDDVVKLIKESVNVDTARNLLIQEYKLSEIQANSILDMKLQRLTSLETEKVKKEQEELLKIITELKDILSSELRIIEIVRKELLEIRENYNDERKTIISDEVEVIETEDLIKEENVVVTTTFSGYIKQIPLDTYRQQRRGGKGVIGTATKEEDIVQNLFITSNLNYLLFITNKGRLHWLKTYQLPEGSRYSKGKAMVNLLSLKENERVTSILAARNFEDDKYILFCTKNGTLKKSKLNDFSNPRKGGIVALNLKDNDEVVSALLTGINDKIIIASRNGQAVKFLNSDIRPMGRNASGVRGIRLINDDVVGMETANDNSTLLTATELGFGKRTKMEDYRLIKRGGKGVRNIKVSHKNGKVIGIKTVYDDDELLLITAKGILIRINIKDISVIGRSTQGVRIMRLDENDKLTSLASIGKE